MGYGGMEYSEAPSGGALMKRNVFAPGITYLLGVTVVLAGWLACAPAPTPTLPPLPTPPPTTPAPPGPEVTINLDAANIAFDKKAITLPANARVTIIFTNHDAVPHNFALYETSAATKAIFIGDYIGGSQTITYQFDAPSSPGTYFFRCNVHPTFMTGDFVIGNSTGQ